MDPVLLCISLVSSFFTYLTVKKDIKIKEILIVPLIIFVSAVVNPIFSHNGVTILFFFKDTPITMEAIFYGVGVGVMISSVLLWFKGFSIIMTSDKLLYICSLLSPRLALIFSMAIRYVPMLTRQREEVKAAQRVMGCYKNGTALEKISSSSRVFSVMVTWALENGVITADSMSARGYGAGRRTHFYIFKFKLADAFFMIIYLLLSLVVLIPVISGVKGFEYYPEIYMPCDIYTVLGYVAFGILTLLPCVLYILEELKWKYLKQRA